MDERLGLALGGGGARAYCSIGCLEVFEEWRVEFAALAGTSMGSVIAALFATGLSAREIKELTAGSRLFQYLTVNFRSLYEGLFQLDKLRRFLRQHLPEDFSALKKPLAVVCTDLDAGLSVAVTEGGLVDAVVASCSIPLLFRPVVRGGRRLVDGGLKGQIPFQPLLDSGCDRVLAVSSGFLAKTRPRYGGLFQIGVRSLDLLGKNQIDVARANPAVTLIEPEIETKAVMSFKSRDFFLEKGRQAARHAMEGGAFS